MRVSVMLSTLIFGLIGIGYALAQYPVDVGQQVVVNHGDRMVPVQYSTPNQPQPGFMAPPSFTTTPPPNSSIWERGWRETWTHEFRPYTENNVPNVSQQVYVTPGNTYVQPQHTYSQPQRTYIQPQQQRAFRCPHTNRVYWYPSTTRAWGCW